MARRWTFVALVWAASRAFFLAVGAVAHARLRAADFIGAYGEPPGTLHYWAHWDGGWFSHIAEHGYDSASATAFFPLFPLLIHGGGAFALGPALAGVAISSVATLAALYFVYRIAEARWDPAVARAATLTLAFFPTALFLNAVYSEALFLMLAAGCLWAALVQRDLVIAGIFGYLAALTRNVGVVLVLPLAWEWFRRRREVGSLGLLGVVAPAVGLGTYMLFLWKGTSQPLLFARVTRTTWGRDLRDPFTTAWRGWRHADDGLTFLVHPWRVFSTTSVNPPFALMNTLSFGFWVLLVVLTIAVVVVCRGALAWYTLPVTLESISAPQGGLPLIGLPRYVLAAFPIFVVVGMVLARRRVALAAWLLVSAACGALLTAMFVTGRWVA